MQTEGDSLDQSTVLLRACRKNLSTLVRRVGVLVIAAFGMAAGTPLHDVVWDGDVEKVRALILAGADIEARNAYGSTALHFASQTGDIEVIRALLDAGADVNARNHSGETALAIGVWHSADVVEMLLRAGADVDNRDAHGLTALMYAVRDHEVKASESEQLENLAVISSLLDAGANANARDAQGRTPLSDIATTGAADDVVPALLAAGADPNTRLTLRGDVSVLMLAAGSANVEAVRALLQAGADVEAKDSRGWTALMSAVGRLGTPELVLALLEAGADPNAVATIRNSLGTTVIMVAATDSHDPHVICVLLKAGADVEARSGRDERTVDLVARNDSPRASEMRLLLDDAAAGRIPDDCHSVNRN